MQDLDVSTAFFRRTEVLDAIDAIRNSSNLVVYAGAGVSIDRSGLSWSRLVEELLSPHVPKAKARRAFVNNAGPLFAASAAHQFYVDASPEPSNRRQLDARQRIVDVLRPWLYGPSLWRGGELANAIADFLYLWNNSYDGSTRLQATRSAALVTTNYDDYLFSALSNAHEIATSQSTEGIAAVSAPPRVRFPTEGDPLIDNGCQEASWVNRELPLVSETSCIHLHGFLPRSQGDGSAHRLPVVSEHDYYRTAKYSESVLTALFCQSNVVIVGASLTDAPLIRALEATRDESNQRWALISMERGTDTDPSGADQRRMIKSRLSAFKVMPIFVDYHVQQAQFFRELIAASKLRTKQTKYGAARNTTAYYARLSSWWKDLRLNASKSGTEAMQYEVHQYLVGFVLPECRAILEARDELMKIEIWIRWNPANERHFRLFGSTMGVWVDYSAMRTEEIALSTDSVIVDTFREGRPQLAPGSSYGGRWPTVLSVPIWSESHQTEFVTAVIILASQRSSRDTVLNEGQNRAALADCTRFLQEVGNFLTDPNSWEFS